MSRGNDSKIDGIVIGYVYGLFASDEEVTLWNCRYIGKTIQKARVRFMRHLSDARDGVDHHSNRWIRSVLARGATIEMHIIETHTASDKETLNDIITKREVVWIASARCNGWRLTNVTDGGEGCAGLSPSEETRQKISAAHKGRKQMPEAIAKMSASRKGSTPWNKGKTGIYSEETLEKIRTATTGRTASEETKKKMSESRKGQGAGIPLAEETKAKISASLTGRKMGPHTPEWNKKISEAHLVKVVPEDMGRRISEGRRRAREERERLAKEDQDRLADQ